MALYTEIMIGNTAQALINVAPSYEFAAGVALLALAFGATVQLPVPERRAVVTVIDGNAEISEAGQAGQEGGV